MLEHTKGQGNLIFGKSVIWVCERDKGLTDEVYSFIKSKKLSIFVIVSYLKDSAFTAVKRDAKF